MKAPEKEAVSAPWTGDFPDVPGGWYLCEFVEGIGINEYPQTVDGVEKKVLKLYVPTAIQSGPLKSDEDGNFNNQRVNAFLPLNGKKTPDKVWNLLWATKLDGEFCDKFEDAESMDDVIKSDSKNLLKFMQVKLPGKSAYVEVTTFVNKSTKKSTPIFNRAYPIADFKEDILPTLVTSDKKAGKAEASKDWDD